MGFFNRTKKEKKAPAGRVEGFYKVTGSGKYAAEYKLDNTCYAVLVGSTVAAGTVVSIQLDEAREVEGVLDILTHENRPAIPAFADEEKRKKSGFSLPVLHTDKIFFRGQPIALVIAETLEDATYAASLVTATYKAAPASVDFDTVHPAITPAATGKERGSLDAWSKAPFIREQVYTIRHQVHNPMEMHATIAVWDGPDKIRLFDKNQGVNNVQQTVSRLWGIPAANIEVMSEYVGGGFGSGLKVWPNVPLAIMAARKVNRPVKLMLTRPQMFTLVGYRPQSWQRVKIGADANGRFTGIWHQAKHGTSVYDNYSEGITRISRLIYNFANLKTDAATVPLNLGAPTWMRGPGDCTGDFALESAIDELCHDLGKDPLQVRMDNLAGTHDPDNGKPWSTNFLGECMQKGAEKIGWNSRQLKPAQVKDGEWMIGYGMANGMWFAGRSRASASIIMQKDGSILVQTAMTDIGTGTGTGIRNIAHDKLGIPHDRIKVKLGHSSLPAAPSQGGSTGLSTISGAVAAVSEALKIKLAGYAASLDVVYKDAVAADVLLSDTGISYRETGSHPVAFAAIWEKEKLDTLEVLASSAPGEERQKYSFCSGAAHFCRVKVNMKTGKVKVDRHVCVVDAGHVVNELAAANQVSGAAVGGIGMALSEGQATDNTHGVFIGSDLAGYHFAVNADAPLIEVEFINKPDLNSNPSGAKGVGEVGIIGAAAAIANAIYNATGKRLRDLPITPDKVLLG
ncbi:MAG: xanthine dehydrogenase family protein molybdopterin-binding subunit [Chitinophagaceae bacterium]|nr:MAG: xanthine dehydrogenase family protein molybdopterin-binding subunit [Chitinophagaceae bacterium]